MLRQHCTLTAGLQKLPAPSLLGGASSEIWGLGKGQHCPALRYRGCSQNQAVSQFSGFGNVIFMEAGVKHALLQSIFTQD